MQEDAVVGSILQKTFGFIYYHFFYPIRHSKDEEALTGQVMDSMDMMFAVMSNAMEGDVNKVKITLSKSVCRISWLYSVVC